MREGSPKARPLVLVSDYDGTLAERGRVAPATLAALARLRRVGVRLVLVTGRQLEDLLAVFPPLDRFDFAVAENGALLYRPESHTLDLLAAPPPAAFVSRLACLGVTPLAVGRVIVATDLPWLDRVQALIDELGLDLRVIRNKGAVMVLPAGVDKGTGMREALRRLGLAPAAALGIGDAENDLDFLAACGWPVAVADALPSVREASVLVTAAEGGGGVREAVRRLLSGKLPEPRRL